MMLGPLKDFLILVSYADAGLLLVGGVVFAVVMAWSVTPKWVDELVNRAVLPAFVMVLWHVLAVVLVAFVSWILGG